MRRTIFNIASENFAGGVNATKQGTVEKAPDEVNSSAASQEQNTKTDPALIVSGPLSEVYTKALDIVFSKNEEVHDKLVTESQAIDAIVNAAVAASVRAKDEEVSMDVQSEDENGTDLNAITFIHVADAKNFDQKTIASIAGQSSVIHEESPETEYIAVIDGATNPFSSPQQKYQEIYASVSQENMQLAQKVFAKHNVKLCFGFEHFIDTLFKSQKK